MGFLDRLLGRTKGEPSVPEPATMPASDVHDHSQGEEQADGAPGEEEHTDDGGQHDH